MSKDSSQRRRPRWKVGQQVEAVWLEDEIWYLAEIVEYQANKRYTVKFVEYGNLQEDTSRRLIREVTPEEKLPGKKKTRELPDPESPRKSSPRKSRSSKRPSVKCPGCGKDNNVGYKFCRKCGAPNEVNNKVAPQKPKKKTADRMPSRKDRPKSVAELPSPEGIIPQLAKKDEKRSKKKPEKKKSSAKKVSCETCGKPNPADYKVCTGCGTKARTGVPAFASKPKPQPVKKSVPEKRAPKKKPQQQTKVDFKARAKDAVLTSGLNVGDLEKGMRVWIDIGSQYISGVVKKKSSKTGVSIQHDDGGEVKPYKPDVLFPRNPPMFDDVADLTQLSYMHEPALLYSLEKRYLSDQIYTFTGPTLIAINPFQRLPMYGPKILQQYVGQPLGKQPPHVYAIAEASFRKMMDFKEPQSVLVSGESGAGKTETTKILLQYLAAMGGAPSSSSSSSSSANRAVERVAKLDGSSASPLPNRRKGRPLPKKPQGKISSSTATLSVSQQVLQSNPVLEAFGNAKTTRNDNSSRFGKFIRIQFSGAGRIEGAQVLTYLLEKPRLVSQGEGERNFHIFYQLCKGASAVDRKQLALKGANAYSYLGNTRDVASIDDVKEFEATKVAMSTCGISKKDQQAIFRILAGILHLGNITFKVDEKMDGTQLDNGKPLAFAAKLLGCKQDEIKKALLRRKLKVGMQVITVRLKPEEAATARDALAMLLYGRLFNYIVKKINASLEGIGLQQDSQMFIGVLDIYGFEFFETNSFEQFCINWANEKLQQQFNQEVFKAEQAEYVKEEIDWTYIEFADNQPILSLIEDKPTGIIPLLDEQCRFPKANHETFATKLYDTFPKHEYFKKPRFSNTAFTIDHYAGEVTYQTDLFLDKNRDYLVPEHMIILGGSKDALVNELFAESAKEFQASGGSMKFASVGGQFRLSLAALMDIINRTQTHYIRCCKPNEAKKPGVFDKKMTLNQLRCGGVLETVRIASAGFPTRWPYQKFCDRYRILAPLLYDEHQASGDWKACALAIIGRIGLQEDQFQTGLTKVFLRSGMVGVFEDLLQRKLSSAASTIGANFKGWFLRRHWLKMRAASVICQTWIRMFLATRLRERLRVARERLEWACRLVQRRRRVVTMRRALKRLIKQERKRRKRKAAAAAQHAQLERCAVRIQAIVRMTIQRRRYLPIRAEARDVGKKYKQVMDAKEQLEQKVEDVNFRLTAESRVKARLQEQLKTSEENLAAQVTSNDELNQQLQAALKQIESLKRENAQLASKNEKLVVQVETAVGKASEEQVAELEETIAEMAKEIKGLRGDLAGERKRAKEITDQVMNAAGVDQLQGKIQEVYGYVPSEPYVGLQQTDESVKAVRSQLETLARMTAKRTKEQSILALLDFVLGISEGFHRDNPLLGYLLVHCLNHWDVFRLPKKSYFFTHVVEGLSVEFPLHAHDNTVMLYYISSVSFLLHCARDGDPDELELDAIIDTVGDELAEEKEFRSAILFKRQLRMLLGRVYSMFVYTMYDMVDPILTAHLDALIENDFPECQTSMTKMLSLFDALVAACAVNLLPPGLFGNIFAQLFYYINAMWLNDLIVTSALCNLRTATRMAEDITLVERWIEAQKHVFLRECFGELEPFRQAISLLLHEKEKLSKKMITDMCPDLSLPQAKTLLGMFKPEVPARQLRLLGRFKDEDLVQLDTDYLYPLPLGQLFPASFENICCSSFPSTMSKLLADYMAQRQVIDDEYVVCEFDLEDFEIGDEMDVMLEEDDLEWSDEVAEADLDSMLLAQANYNIMDDEELDEFNDILEETEEEEVSEEMPRTKQKKSVTFNFDPPEERVYKVGEEVEAVYLDDSMYYLARIEEVLPDSKGYRVLFTEYGNEQQCTREMVRDLTEFEDE